MNYLPNQAASHSQKSSTTKSLLNNRKSALLNPIDITAIIVGTGISLGAIFGSIYILTRPCSLGECQAIVRAENQWQQLEKALQQSDTGELIELQPQLRRSRNQIQAIPLWSSYHQQARTWQNKYQQLDSLDLILKTISTNPLAESTNFQSLTLAENQQQQQQWQSAIKTLQTIGSADKFYSFAQTTIGQYQSLLDQIRPIVAKQTQYQQQLETAQKQAQQALAAQNQAQTLAEWEQVEGHWQAALAFLQAIESSAQDLQVESLMASYQKQLERVQQRREIESTTIAKLAQIKEDQQQAQQFQRENQWSQAVIQWQSAIALAQSIPQSSSQYDQVQSWLAEAQAQLAKSTRMQQVQTHLDATCSGEASICQVKITSDKIQVQLTPKYTKKIRETAIAARDTQQYDKQIDLLVHIHSLEDNLATIAHNYQIPIELYSDQGKFIARYQ